MVFVDEQGDRGGASVAHRAALATVMAFGGDTRGRETMEGVGWAEKATVAWASKCTLVFFIFPFVFFLFYPISTILY